jgi:hypothetical protein
MKELNRDILTQAIKQLPNYTPGDVLWTSIEIDLAKEQNRDTLESALQNLPVHTPKASVWNQISEQLPEAGLEKQLPQYAPPDFVWDKIEDELKKETEKQPVIRRRLYFQLASAAAILLVVASFFFMRSGASEPLMYTVEWIDESGADMLQELEDDDAFAVIETICADQPPACKEPEFQMLQAELDFLSNSLLEIKANMNVYDDNSQLIAEITEIELERNEVAKQMIDRLL